MKIITSNDELEVGMYYWCRSKKPYVNGKHSITIQRVGCQGKWKYIGNRIWAEDENNQALKTFDILGPVEYPDFDSY